MAPLPDDHNCGWKGLATDLQTQLSETHAQLQAVTAKMAELERRLLGPKSEKLKVSPQDRDVKEKRPPDRAAIAAARRKNAELRATKLVTEDVPHRVPDDQRQCPACQRGKLKPLGERKVSTTFEYVPGFIRRRRHIRETLACTCGGHVVTAPAPDHCVEKTRYGDSFRAYVVTGKCADSVPLYRLAKQLSRLGVPISRSTLTDLFHQAATELMPLSDRLVKLVASAEVVQADETSLKMQTPNKRGFVWTFLADKLIAYRFSSSRSGETPSHILGGSAGTLVVDMYTGYNEITSTGGRIRAACLAHARRRFFEALAYAPEAKAAIDIIRDVYVVEHDAKAAGVCGTDEHTQMRQGRTKPIMARLHAWMIEQRPNHAPKGPMGTALSYALNNWTELTRFLHDAKIPPDNNRAESALRVVALGRKNFLFVGHEDAGKNIAGLYSLVATCEANGVDPIAYLTDVLGRVGTHPNAMLDDLLPHKWKPSG